MKSTLTHHLLTEIETLARQVKKGKKKMSKLTDAVTGLQTAFTDLKDRVQKKEDADATAIADLTTENATLTQENDDAVTTINDLTAQLAALENAPPPTTGTGP